MNTSKTNVRFYHSMVCPRCHMAGLWLSQLRSEFPDVEVEKLELFTNFGAARADGVGTIPALVAGDRKLSGFILTKGGIRRFLESLPADETTGVTDEPVGVPGEAVEFESSTGNPLELGRSRTGGENAP